MDKEMINLIFSHIKDLGAEGADLFQLYILAHYGVNILIGLIITGGLYLISRAVIRAVCAHDRRVECFDQINSAINNSGRCVTDKEHQDVYSFINKAIEKHKKGEL